MTFSIYSTIGQETKKGIFNIKKIGVLYNYGNEKNFIFDDKDYFYTTNTIKAQLFYDLGSWKGLKIELIVQPQVQFLKHQLENLSYVTPDQPNFQEKTDEFSKLKSMRLYALEFGLAAKKRLAKKLDMQVSISLGFASIDTRTERLAKGFTFIENFSLGLTFNIFRKSYLYLGTNFGHVSNLNFTKPNDGYNILGFEIGYSLKLN